jgi:formyl-CoA transferase
MSFLEALEHRRQTGEGRHIALSETGLIEDLLEDQETPHQLENVYLCKDGKWCAITVDKEDGWEGLKHTVGNLPVDRAERDIALGEWVAGYNAGDVMSMLQQNGIPCGIVQDAGDLAQNVQLKARKFFIKKEDAPLTDASPIKMEKGGADYSRAAPPPGLDNDYVYVDLLGLSKKDIATLKKNEVI